MKNLSEEELFVLYNIKNKKYINLHLLRSKNFIENFPNLWNLILDIKGETISEKIYNYIFIDKNFDCKSCGCDTKFLSYKRGYREFCSKKCSNNDLELINKRSENYKINNLNKYGVENTSKLESVKNKTKNTCLKKYQETTPLKNLKIKEKIKITCIKKYGVDNPSKSEEVKRKKIKKYIQKYGVDNPSKSDEVKEKIKKVRIKNGSYYNLTDEEYKNLKSYRASVSYYTNKTYIEFKDEINPLNLIRGIKNYHIDHIFPISEGWKNNIDPKHLSNKNNLRIILAKENREKSNKTNMTLKEFYELIKLNKNE